MLADLALIGTVVVAVIGVLEVAARLDGEPTRDLPPESVVREAMRGPEGSAVRAEYRRSGIVPPERGSVAGFR